ncbi:MAG: V-type ATPase 116kDa subunit family protein [Syntrophobacteraceae bacterium]|nr:V-type ATPase 116kDa subunit family protein [Syntrophobacteraceae bacterium]
MFAKSDIRKITIAVEKNLHSEVFAALGKASIVHLARVEENNSRPEARLEKEESCSREILAGVEYILNALHISPEEAGAPTGTTPAREGMTFVVETKRIVERALRLLARIGEQAEAVARRVEQANALGQMGIDPVTLGKARLIKTTFGMVARTDWEPPSSERFAITRAGGYVFGVALPADFPEMDQFIEGGEFTDLSRDIAPVPLEELRKRAGDLNRRREIVLGYVDRLKEERGSALNRLRTGCLTHQQVLAAERMSLFSAGAMFLSGWMDVRDRDRLVAILEGICGDRFLISEHKDPGAPVRLRNSKLFKPFELLVKIMGMPSNSEIDPTPFTAITFVLMFGLMFGDFGQGLVIVLAGVILKRLGVKKSRDQLAQAGGVMIACGGCAAVCGLLYGSVFSSEHIIAALWFNPAEHVMRLFSVTILMGVVFIMTGLCVNIVNSFLGGDLTEAFFEKRGLVVLALYAAVVFCVVRYEVSGRLPSVPGISLFIVLPLVLFSLKGVLGPALFKSAGPQSISEYIIETALEILEIGLGLFANTISFIRVGAFALAHAALSIVTYTLAAMADPELKSAGAIVVIIAGNLFIIGFESMICTIQSMRLEYYEFFSKFFKGEGVVFMPFTLKGKASEV